MCELYRYSMIEKDDNGNPKALVIKELFLGFHEAKDQTALAMSKQIIKSINDKNIPLNKCRGQGYDGANTMEGTYGGVQKLIKDIEPNAVCVHCAAHNLNLVLNDAVREILISWPLDRPMCYVRCDGEHPAANCKRLRENKPTCANCAGPHTVNDRRCPVFRRKARARELKIPPALQGKDLRRPEAKKGFQDPPQEGNTMMERKHAPPTPHRKVETDPSPGIKETMGLVQRVESTKNPEQLPIDSTPQCPTQQMLPKIKRGKRSKIRRKVLQQQQQRQQQPTEPRATATMRQCPPTPTTTTSTNAPGGSQSENSHVRHDKDAHSNTSLNQDRPGPDTEHSGGPDTRGDVLDLRILYWNPGGIIEKTRKLCDIAQLEDAHIILLGKTKLRPEQELRIPNFFAYRRNEISALRPAYRGTAVLIRRDLMHEA
ncbi:Zinc finger MYM-type protein 1 [Eumeta japonica]|uniref:Zinc finger MYM-type protein 1 n=1 Tax=Eumeta variegata TaxID=151549 RepID=A0A4C1XDK8_EUMVA|nr:Zinc finger MYM-type protein 1 [Eumeta japonica]